MAVHDPDADRPPRSPPRPAPQSSARTSSSSGSTPCTSPRGPPSTLAWSQGRRGRAGRVLREAGGGRRRRRPRHGGRVVADVVNQVGLVLRFLPSFRWLRRLVHDERAGRGWRSCSATTSTSPIRASTARRGGSIPPGPAGHPARALDPRCRHPAVDFGPVVRSARVRARCTAGRIDDVAVARWTSWTAPWHAPRPCGTTCSSAQACAESRCSASGCTSRSRATSSVPCAGSSPARPSVLEGDDLARPSRPATRDDQPGHRASPPCGTARPHARPRWRGAARPPVADAGYESAASGGAGSRRPDGRHWWACPGSRRPSPCHWIRRGRSPCPRPTASCATAQNPFVREQRLLDGATAAAKACTWTRSRHRLTMVSEYVTFRPPGHVGMKMVRGPWFFKSFSGGWNFTPAEPD